MAVSDVDVLTDGGFEFDSAAMGTTFDLLGGEIGEEAFDLIDPGRTLGREVKMEARVPQEPALDHRCLVRPVVVEHEMGFQVLRDASIDGVEELSELNATVTSVMLSDDPSALHVEGCKERGRPVSHIVVGTPFDLPRPQRQDGLAAVQGLDLRLLVHAQYQRAVGRVQIESHDIAHLLDQQRVGRELEALGTMRPETESTPDATDAASAQARSLGQRPRTPVRRVLGLALECQRDDFLHMSVADLARCSRPRFVQQPVNPVLDETCSPAADSLTGDAELLGDVAVVSTLRATQHDARSQGQRLGRGASASQSFQLYSLLRRYNQLRLRSSRSHRRSPCTGEREPQRYSSVISESGH